MLEDIANEIISDIHNMTDEEMIKEMEQERGKLILKRCIHLDSGVCDAQWEKTKDNSMTYKSLGRDIIPSCTPAPTTIYDKRSCRERTKCTRECSPKKLKCEWCGSMDSYLNVLEEVETGKRISICNKCEKTI